MDSERQKKNQPEDETESPKSNKSASELLEYSKDNVPRGAFSETTLECKDLLHSMVNSVSLSDGLQQEQTDCEIKRNSLALANEKLPAKQRFNNYLDEVLERKSFKPETIIVNEVEFDAPEAPQIIPLPEPKNMEINANPSKVDLQNKPDWNDHPQHDPAPVWNLPVSKAEILAMLEIVKRFSNGTSDTSGANGSEFGKYSLPRSLQQPLAHLQPPEFAVKTAPQSTESYNNSFDKEAELKLCEQKAFRPPSNPSSQDDSSEEISSKSNNTPEALVASTSNGPDKIEYCMPEQILTPDKNAPVFFTEEEDEDLSGGKYPAPTIKEVLAADFEYGTVNDPCIEANEAKIIENWSMKNHGILEEPIVNNCFALKNDETENICHSSLLDNGSEIDALLASTDAEGLFPTLLKPTIVLPKTQFSLIPELHQPNACEEVEKEISCSDEAEVHTSSSILDSETGHSLAKTIAEEDVPSPEFEEVKETGEKEDESGYEFEDVTEDYELTGNEELVEAEYKVEESEDFYEEIDKSSFSVLDVVELFGDEVEVREVSEDVNVNHVATMLSDSEDGISMPSEPETNSSGLQPSIFSSSADEIELVQMPEVSEDQSESTAVNSEDNEKTTIKDAADNTTTKLETMSYWDSTEVLADQEVTKGFSSIHKAASPTKYADFLDRGQVLIGSNLGKPSEDTEEPKNEKRFYVGVDMVMDDMDNENDALSQEEDEPQVNSIMVGPTPVSKLQNDMEIMMKPKSATTTSAVFDKKKVSPKKPDKNKRRKWCVIL